jgi:RNA methyltransferase, TrmH family
MTDLISSNQNARVKLAHALQTGAKERRAESKMVLEGMRLVRDAILRGHVPHTVLFDPAAVTLEALGMAESDLGRIAFPATPEVMRYISDTETPQGVAGIFPITPPPLADQPTHMLILDAIRDPGNMGTILRSAAASGVQGVLLAPGCVDAYNPKVLRAGMGAHLRVPVLEASWTRIALYCGGLSVYLADMTGDVAYDAVDWTQPHALIIGSEAHGDSEQAAQLASQRVFIPMAGDTESLNASVAAGILLAEAWRQRSRA